MFHILYCSTRISSFFLLLPHPIFINKNCCCYVLVFLRTLPRCGAVRCGAVRCGAVRCSAVRFSAGVWMGLRSVASFLAPPFGHLPAPRTHPPTYLPTCLPTYLPTYLRLVRKHRQLNTAIAAGVVFVVRITRRWVPID